jgi:hypothetical protein
MSRAHITCKSLMSLCMSHAFPLSEPDPGFGSVYSTVEVGRCLDYSYSYYQ